MRAGLEWFKKHMVIFLTLALAVTSWGWFFTYRGKNRAEELLVIYQRAHIHENKTVGQAPIPPLTMGSSGARVEAPLRTHEGGGGGLMLELGRDPDTQAREYATRMMRSKYGVSQDPSSTRPTATQATK